MEANELRIGNWVECYNNFETVTDIISDYGQYFVDTSGHRSIFLSETEVIKPIPLTKEWLIKFGAKENIYKDFWFDFDGITYLSLTKSDGKWYPIVGQAPEMSHQDEQIISLICIEYVHQLQNLYFSLMREELTIEE